MSRWISLFVIVAVAWSGLSTESRAQRQAAIVPSNTKFVLRLDVKAFRETDFGGKLFELAKKTALKELAEDGDGPSPEKIEEMLGFDPFEEIQGITVSASDYKHPEKSLVASIRMRKTTGNLEGLVLGLPGYEAEDHGKYQIHTAAPEKDVHLFGSIHSGDDGDKTIVLSSQRDAVTNLLDHLDGKTAGDSYKRIEPSDEGNAFLALQVFELPEDLIDEGPPANVAKIVRALSLQVSESGNDLNVGMMVTAHNEKQAEQLRQMAQGLIAMIDLAQSSDPDDEDLKRIKEFAQDLKADRDGSSVKVSLSVPADEVTKLIEEELSDN